ncbi:MAG: glycoside hydrolase [Planctomycetes bacterium]|nr:glycoside hydrolase [Planctomycetota bacterium]
MTPDPALTAPPLNTAPGPEYHDPHRRFQGIPGIERSAHGRLFAAWYSGGAGEGPENYVLVVKSDDDGVTWSRPILVIDPPGRVRAFDPVLWHDPSARLWLFWAQSLEWYDGRAGVWAARCDRPDEAAPTWSAPRRLCDGVMMNKPTVLHDGTWLLPACLWNFSHPTVHITKLDALREQHYSNVFASRDSGQTFARIGSADVPGRTHDEHMILERSDGSLLMLVRTHYGIGKSTSRDGGAAWSPGENSGLPGPDARFFIRRLRSGRVLLINHHNFHWRDHLTALLSDDDGQTWPHTLLLDERAGVSYPDAVESADGRIYAIYDRNRTTDREILMAVFTEADVVAGRCVDARSRLGVVISRVGC